jgi:DNA-nicking Smr family endonuclease
MKKRTPSAAERDLWRHVVRDAKPLPGRAAEPPIEPEPALEENVAAKEARPTAASSLRRAGRPPPPELVPGRIAGVDKRLAERLRRGQLPIEASLDLHGSTQEAAHRQLDGFISAAAATGKRCVLVITGKGLWKEDAGVLREAVPRWLNEPANRARVLAITAAQPRHGGIGALYVLLKRKREP